jgi:hypothetical protein
VRAPHVADVETISGRVKWTAHKLYYPHIKFCAGAANLPGFPCITVGCAVAMMR